MPEKEGRRGREGEQADPSNSMLRFPRLIIASGRATYARMPEEADAFGEREARESARRNDEIDASAHRHPDRARRKKGKEGKKYLGRATHVRRKKEDERV